MGQNWTRSRYSTRRTPFAPMVAVLRIVWSAVATLPLWLTPRGGGQFTAIIARNPGSAGSESGSAAAALHSSPKETTYRVKLDSIAVLLRIVWSAVATLPLWLTPRGGGQFTCDHRQEPRLRRE